MLLKGSVVSNSIKRYCNSNIWLCVMIKGHINLEQLDRLIWNSLIID